MHLRSVTYRLHHVGAICQEARQKNPPHTTLLINAAFGRLGSFEKSRLVYLLSIFTATERASRIISVNDVWRASAGRFSPVTR